MTITATDLGGGLVILPPLQRRADNRRPNIKVTSINKSARGRALKIEIDGLSRADLARTRGMLKALAIQFQFEPREEPS